MNVLLLIVLAVVVILVVCFFYAIHKASPGGCVAVFLITLILVGVLVFVATTPPKMETLLVRSIDNNTIVLADTRGNTVNYDITKIPRVSYNYPVNSYVQLTRNFFGTPLFLSPADYTIVPTKR